MSKRALVILGAGAAHDIVPVINGQSFGPAEGKYRPPLTKDIFRDNDLTRETLNDYPGARILAGSIRFDLLNDDNIEPLLYRLWKVEDGPRAQQFPEVPLFLQDFFGRISNKYTNQPVNYARLADMLFAGESGFEGIAFVTLNYDTLLEKVLDPHYLEAPIRTIDSYITGRCLLVKLHGSVNWARRLRVEPNGETPSGASLGRRDYLSLLRSLGNVKLQMAMTNVISLRDPTDLWTTGTDREHTELYYPALSVPLGEYEPICPSNHIERLKEFLRGCRNVLAIGISGRDQDLLRLLTESLPGNVDSFWLVDKGEENARKAHSNFVSQCPNLRAKFPAEPLTGGFTDFLVSGGLEKFIKASV